MNGDADDDRWQIDTLYKKYAQHLYNYARLGAGRDPEVAMTAVQEAFKAAWERRNEFLALEVEHQRCWLFRVVSNNVINSYTRGAGKFEMPREVPDINYLRAQTSGSPLRAAVLADALSQCLVVIKTMPPIRQKVFFMRAHEWKPSEIAEMLGITPSTVRDHVRAGLRQLNTAIGPIQQIFTDLEDESENGGER